MDEREFRGDLGGASGEASGAKAAATMNIVKEKSAKRVEGEYVRFFVRDKNGDGPPDVPKQAILQDGMYWDSISDSGTVKEVTNRLEEKSRRKP